MCKLAIELHKSYTEIENLPLREILIWQEYFSRIPFSEERDDLRTAMVCAAIANYAGKVSKKEMKPKDFLLDFSSRKPQDTKNKARLWVMAQQIQQKGK